MMSWSFIYQLLLCGSAINYVATAMISLEQTEMNVKEDEGNVNIYLTTGEMELCLKIITLPDGAEEDKDYKKVETVLMTSGYERDNVSIHIIDDDMTESDEKFRVLFTEVEAESYPSQCDSIIVGSGSSNGIMDTSTMLRPMLTNATAVITIKDDDDNIIVSKDKESSYDIAAISVVVVIIILVLITLFIGIAFLCYTKRKKRVKLTNNTGTDGYFEINSFVTKPIRDEDDRVSTNTINTSTEGVSPSPSASAIIPTTDIPALEFSAHVKELHKDADKGFNLQFSLLNENSPKPLPWKTAEKQENIAKNRYNNILPYDNTRVVLSKTDKKHSDYINASWINGYKKEKTYVTCQGPLPETVDDFWRMIWEQKIPTIVMLTKTVEASRKKCEQYWPDKVEETITFDRGNLTVLLKKFVPFADYELRRMIISCGTEKQKVTHYYFQSWPDHGVPRYATALLGFIRNVRKWHFPSDPNPLAVHCSAGVGRTGTFIVLDIMLQVLEAQAGINVYECILKLRDQRCSMVQTEAQYIFIHDALEELITCGKNEISVADLRIAMKRLNTVHTETNITGFQQQFQLLEQVTRQPLQKDLETSQKTYNKDKNRYPHALPYNFDRVCLRVTGQPGSDYINASWINGYRQSNTFIVTQGPLNNTVLDVWRMVWETSSRTIVMLCDLVENDKEVCVQYWPEEKTKQCYGKLTVKNKKEQAINDSLHTRMFEVYRSGSAVTPVPEVMSVTQFHLSGWPGSGQTCQPDLLLDLVNRVLKNQISTGNKPVLVMCSDGSGRSGVFVVLYSQLERLKTEHMVDVFQGIKAARTQRMGIVHSVECYKQIHELLIQYLTSFDDKNYQNFTAVS